MHILLLGHSYMFIYYSCRELCDLLDFINEVQKDQDVNRVHKL